MKKMALVTLSAVFVGSLAFAADAQDKSNTTVDHSKNPITGTETVTKKTKKKVKDGAGNEAEVTVKDKTKMHKDGQVDHERKVEAESETSSK